MKTSKSVKTSVAAICAAMMLMSPACVLAAEPADETAPAAETLPIEVPADTSAAQPEEVPDGLSANTSEVQSDALAMELQSVDSETAVLLAEQMKAQQQGYALRSVSQYQYIRRFIDRGCGRKDAREGVSCGPCEAYRCEGKQLWRVWFKDYGYYSRLYESWFICGQNVFHG